MAAGPRILGLLIFCAGGALLIPTLEAQKVVSARAGLITFVQGPAFVDGRRVILKTTRYPQMKNGETLSTGRGRAELLLAPGVILRLAESSQVRMDETLLAETRVTLQKGDALIEIVQLAEGNRIEVVLEHTITELSRPGLYRFDTSHDTTPRNTLRVYGGEALVRSGTGTASLKRGMAVDLDPNPNSGLAPGLVPSLLPRKFDRKQTDFLHAWAARRSFELFMGDPETRQKQTHWQSAGGGYVENKNYGVEFRAYIRRRPPPFLSTRPPIPPADTP